MNKNDSLRLELLSDEGKTLFDVRAGAGFSSGVLSGASAKARRDEKEKRWIYQFSWPKTLTGANPFRLKVSALDNDGDGLKQVADWGGDQGARLLARP